MLLQLLNHPIYAPLLAGVLGAILGSFIGALAERMPRGERIVAGRSHCQACSTTLSWRDLVPILSYLLLKGRCRHCHAPIGRAALWTEIFAIAVGVVSFMFIGGWPALLLAIFGWLLMPLAITDARCFWLPDILTLALGGVGLVIAVTGTGSVSIMDAVIGGLAGFAFLWAIARGYKMLRGREGLGGGDPKLLAAIGLWLGWKALPFVLLGASIIGLFIATVLALRGSKIAATTRLPFGAMMAFSAWYVALLISTGVLIL